MTKRSYGRRQIGRGDRRVRGLGLPVDADHPPAGAVVEQLDAVDPPHEGRGVRQAAHGLIGRPDVDDASEPFGAAGDLTLVEALADEEGFAAGDVFVGRDRTDPALPLPIGSGGHETPRRMEQRAETVPVAGDAGVAGDDVIEGRDDGFGRGHVGRGGGRDRRRRRLGRRRTGAGEDHRGREDRKAHERSPIDPPRPAGR